MKKVEQLTIPKSPPNSINKIYQAEIGSLIKKLTLQKQPLKIIKDLSLRPKDSPVKPNTLRESLLKNTFTSSKGANSSRIIENSYFQEEKEGNSPCLTDRGQSYIRESSAKNETKEIQESTKKIKKWTENISNRDFKDLLGFESYLNELIKVLKSQSKFDLYTVNDEFLLALFELIKSSLFRMPKYKVIDTNLDSIPYANREILDELILQEDSTTFKIRDINWKNLTLIYEILVILLNNYYTNSSIKKYIDKFFLQNLIANMQNFDMEERYIVKLIVHKLYGASLYFRQSIIKLIENKLIDILYTSQKSSDILSVNEILELLKCIISGMKMPMKKNTVNLLVQVIFPLIKNKFIKYFFVNYKNFIVKICPLSKEILIKFINFLNMSWPVRYPEKCVYYIELFENLFELDIFKEVLGETKNLKSLMKKFTICLKDVNFLIADKSLSLFKSSKIVDLFSSYNFEKIIAKNLVENIVNHWSDEIQLISKLVIAKLMNFHKSFIDKIGQEEKNFIDKIDISEYKEEIWGIHFALKAD